MSNSIPAPSPRQVNKPIEQHFTYISEYCDFVLQHIDEILDREETGDLLAGFIIRAADLIVDTDKDAYYAFFIEGIERYIDAYYPELPFVQGGAA